MGRRYSVGHARVPLQVQALLFEPPPFNPAKLTTAWLPGVTRCGPYLESLGPGHCMHSARAV